MEVKYTFYKQKFSDNFIQYLTQSDPKNFFFLLPVLILNFIALLLKFPLRTMWTDVVFYTYF